MRLSVDRGDPGYLDVPLHDVKVTLDGEPVRYCVTADEELGAVVVHKIDVGGKLMLTPDGQRVAREVRRGKVVIELGEQAKTFAWPRYPLPRFDAYALLALFDPAGLHQGSLRRVTDGR